MSFNYDHKSIQMRRGTSSEWREYGDKCVPLEAEICVELMQYPDGTINKNVGVKVGNGIDSYEQLPYVILNEELDPVFTNHPAYQITQEMIDNWNLSQVEPGEEYGQVTRWDGTEWVPSSIILLKDVEGIEVHRNVVPDEKSRRDVGSEEKPFSRGYFDNLIADDITSKEINVEGSINVEGEVNIDGQIIINNENIGDGLGDLEERLEQEIDDRIEGDKNLNNKIDSLATDDLTDVNSASASLDQFLIHNGVQWVAEDFHIDTELTFKGGISVPNDPAPAEKRNGDLYINNEDGVAGQSWTGIAGRTINAANAVGWSDTNARWYMLGDIASAAVMRVEAGTGIDVNDAKPAEPVVSIDRTEVDKWYSDINHDHEGLYIEEEVDPTVPQHVKDITTVDIGRWDEAHGWGDHSLEGYLKESDIHDPDWATVTDGDYNENVYLGYTSKNIFAAYGTVSVGYDSNGGMLGVAVGHNARSTDNATAVGEGAEANGTLSIALGTAAKTAKAGEFVISPQITDVNFSNATVQATDYLDANGNSIIKGDYTLPLAGNGTRGGVQVGYNTSGKNYAVQLSGEKMYVNVPWTDTNTDLYGWWNLTVDGASTTQIGSKATVDFRGGGDTTVTKSGNTITISSSGGGGSNYTLPLAANGTRGGVQVGYSANGKNYPVQLSGEKMFVNVPWTNTNTTYSQATASTLGLVKIGFTTNSSSRNYAVQLSNGQMYVNVPWVEGSGGGTTYKAGKGIRLDVDTFTVAAGNGLAQDDSGLRMSGSYTGTFAATGDITAYSDEKLKTNITTAPVGIIDQLRGVEFEWKEDGRAGSGLIAQELEKVLPHLVHDREDGNKSVNYMGLVGYLIEEVKALKAEVEVLRDASK